MGSLANSDVLDEMQHNAGLDWLIKLKQSSWTEKGTRFERLKA